MEQIASQLASVRARMDAACAASGRDPSQVELIAVSKTFPAEAVQAAVDAGHRCFGESRLQEAQAKIPLVSGAGDWHFIGRVQGNKVRKILGIFAVVHGIDSWDLAAHTNRIAGELGLRPKVFLQVNIGAEPSKGGFAVEDLEQGIAQLSTFSHLEVLGLMCIPPAADEGPAARRWFAVLRTLRDRLAPVCGLPLASLSMGMSGDFEEAILEGSTHVRVGSAIFGKR